MESAVRKSVRWKIVSAVLAFSTLSIGGTIYLLFRPSYLLMFDWLRTIHLFGVLDSIRFTNHSIPEWIEYSLPDGLWVFSYFLFIGCIWDFNIDKCWFFLLILPFVSVLDEMLQFFHLVPGTFDLLDIVAYIVASYIGMLYLHVVRSSIIKRISV